MVRNFCLSLRLLAPWAPARGHMRRDLSRKRPLFKNEWVEMGDPAPLRRRTHGGAGAGALALVKPSPPKAVAGRPGFTRAKRPRLQSPPADRWAAIQDLALAPSLLPGATSPIRNSKEPLFYCRLLRNFDPRR